MKEYLIRAEFLSDAVFGNGEAGSDGTDIELQHDSLGVPYVHGKMLKACLLKEARTLCALTKNTELERLCRRMFGTADRYEDKSGSLKLSDLRLHDEIMEALESLLSEEQPMVLSEDIFSAMTVERGSISISEKTGSSLPGSEHRLRALKAGFVYYAHAALMEEDCRCLEAEESLLAASLSLLRGIGVKRTRGKGAVRMRLLLDGADITEEAAKRLFELFEECDEAAECDH